MSAGSTPGLTQALSLDRPPPSSSAGSALLNEYCKRTPLSLPTLVSTSPGLMSSTSVVKKRGKGRPPGSKNLPKPLPGAPLPPRKQRGRPKKSIPLGPDGQPIPSPPRRARGRPRRDPSLPQPPKRSRVRARLSVPVISPVINESGTISANVNMNTMVVTEETDSKETPVASDESTTGWAPVEVWMNADSSRVMPRYELETQAVKVDESRTTTGSFYQLANQSNPETLPLVQPTDSFEAFEFPDFPFSFDFPAFLQEIQQYRRIQDDRQPADNVQGQSGRPLLTSSDPSSLLHCTSSSPSSIPSESVTSPGPLPSSHTHPRSESQTQQARTEPMIRTRHKFSPEPPLVSETEPAPLADSFAFDMPAFLLEIQQYHRDHFQGKEDDGGDGDGRW